MRVAKSIVNRRALLLATAIGAAAATAATAQDAGAPGGRDIEELVVTAQRREERLQDVPVAVTALSGEALESLGIEGSKELSQVTPGLNFTQSVYSPQPTVRGVGTRGVGSGDESVVPIYINGVYQPFIMAADLQLNNVQRIEVLKGPQGALFGRNATGGAINIVTKRPGEGFTGSASYSYGRFNEHVGKAYVSAGSGPLGADLAVIARTDDGYIKDVLNGKRYGRVKDVAVRTQVAFEPTDNISLLLGVGHTNNADRTGSANQAYAGNTTARRFGPGVFVATRPYEAALNLPPNNKVLQNSGYLVGTFRFDAFDLNTVTGVQTNKLKATADSDATPLPALELFVAQGSRSVYQEVYGASKGDGPLSWIVGGVYYRDYASSNPSLAPSGTVTLNPNGTFSRSTNASSIKTNSLAAYAQVTYDVTEALSVTVAGRYTADERSFTNRVLVPTVGPLATGGKTFKKFTPSANAAYRVNEQLNLYAKAGKAFKSGLFSIVAGAVRPVEPETVTQYEVGFKADPMPWFRLNGSAYYTDYKGLQTTSRDPATGIAFLQNAASAEIYGVELETVLRPVDRLNLTGGVSILHAEYVRFPNAQISVPNPIGSAVGVPTGTQPCPAGVFPCGNNSGAIVDVSGNKLIRTPFLTANLGGDYTVPIGYGDVVLSGNIYYSGHSWWDALNRLRERSKTLVNAQARWNLPDEHTSFTVWGENLLDIEHNLTLVTSSSDTNVFARPRTYGVRLDYRW